MIIHSGHYQKLVGTPNNVVIECENHGCNTSCIFYKGTRSTTDTLYHPQYGQYYERTEIVHLCERIADVANRRHEIYSRAMQESDDVPITLGGSVTRSCSKKMEVFDKITAEYRCEPCPFYLGTSL